MTQQPDKFFRDKLRNHEASPPPAAWDRISAGLGRKRTRTTWINVAASVLVLSAVAALLYPRLSPTPDRLTDGVERNEFETSDRSSRHRDTVTSPEVDEHPAVEQLDAAGKQPAPPAQIERPPRAFTARTNEDQRGKASDTATDALVAELAEPDSEPVAQELTVEDASATTHASTAADITPDKRQRVTIVFTREEVNEKYLVADKKEDATPGQKKPSGIKKVLEIAQDLKHNQDPIGELRQIKNEVLAVSFKSQKDNNKVN